ncbi:MAG: hypothetical protein KDC46_03990 [Thermoleophilia bacterium]|nr:hypothetical protein [Thermoleophilia bacterium]
MKQQHVANEQLAIRYADGIDHLWASWEPAVRSCQRVFGGRAWRTGIDPQDLAGELRRAQYRAHTSGEFATGLVPPPSARDAHVQLLGSLGACRDVLGVLAIRAELCELDEDAAEIGMQAVDATRDSFMGARSTTALVQAWVADDAVDPAWLHGVEQPQKAWPISLWLLLGTCTLLLLVLLAEVIAGSGLG